MDKIVLASASPRRRELLNAAGIAFTVLEPDADETLSAGISPAQAVQLLAERKAAAVAELPKARGRTIVAADTVVALGSRILGKPRSRGEAELALRALSGNTHEVFTGVYVRFANGERARFFERTEVEFYPLSDEEIAEYAASGEPMDKAGAYGIQGKGMLLVRRICGDYANVVGLPVARLWRVLSEHGK